MQDHDARLDAVVPWSGHCHCTHSARVFVLLDPVIQVLIDMSRTPVSQGRGAATAGSRESVSFGSGCETAGVVIGATYAALRCVRWRSLLEVR